MILSDAEILKGNILIDIFMGAQIDNSFPDKNRVYKLGNRIELDTTLKYHSDWNILKSVIDKIFIISFDSVKGLEEYCNKHNTIFDPISYGLHSSIEEVFKAIVKFIEWYNVQSKI